VIFTKVELWGLRGRGWKLLQIGWETSHLPQTLTLVPELQYNLNVLQVEPKFLSVPPDLIMADCSQ
jgi:hypothetical protein